MHFSPVLKSEQFIYSFLRSTFQRLISENHNRSLNENRIIHHRRNPFLIGQIAAGKFFLKHILAFSQ